MKLINAYWIRNLLSELVSRIPHTKEQISNQLNVPKYFIQNLINNMALDMAGKGQLDNKQQKELENQVKDYKIDGDKVSFEFKLANEVLLDVLLVLW